MRTFLNRSCSLASCPFLTNPPSCKHATYTSHLTLSDHQLTRMLQLRPIPSSHVSDQAPDRDEYGGSHCQNRESFSPDTWPRAPPLRCIAATHSPAQDPEQNQLGQVQLPSGCSDKLRQQGSLITGPIGSTPQSRSSRVFELGAQADALLFRRSRRDMFGEAERQRGGGNSRDGGISTACAPVTDEEHE